MSSNTENKKNGRRQTIGSVPASKISMSNTVTKEMYDKVTAELKDRTLQLSSLEKKYTEMATNFKSLEEKFSQYQNEVPAMAPVPAPPGQPSLSSFQIQLNESKQEALQYSSQLSNLQYGWSNFDFRLSQVERQLHDQRIDLEEQKQYSMRNDLMIKKLKNLPVKSVGESFSKFNKRFDTYIYKTLNELLPNLETALTLNDIDTSHVLYEGSDLVLVRFSNRRARNDVYFNKRDLKGNQDKIVISEHLTKYRQSLLKFAMKTVGNRNAWSKKCEIFIKVGRTIYPVWSENEVLQRYGYGERKSNRRHHPSTADSPPGTLQGNHSNAD